MRSDHAEAYRSFTLNHHLRDYGEQFLLLYTDAPTPQTTKWNKQFWSLSALPGVVIFTMNSRNVLKTTGRKPDTVKGRGRAKPRSCCALPSGDNIPGVALGESAP